MPAPRRPIDDAERVATLHDLLILDTPPEERFDAITRYAASLFNVPVALVTLVDTERQWFKSACGIDRREGSRDTSFCGHAILDDDIFEIPDASADPRFADNPMVVAEPRIRFYAGAPLVMPNGHRLGTLCLIDRVPRRLGTWEKQHLQALAALVVQELQGRSAAEAFAALRHAAPGEPSAQR